MFEQTALWIGYWYPKAYWNIESCFQFINKGLGSWKISLETNKKLLNYYAISMCNFLADKVGTWNYRNEKKWRELVCNINLPMIQWMLYNFLGDEDETWGIRNKGKKAELRCNINLPVSQWMLDNFLGNEEETRQLKQWKECRTAM